MGPRLRLRRGWLLLGCALAVAAHAQVEPRALQVHAAGSLRAAFEQLALAFEQTQPVKLALTFGASGLLKDRLIAGEASQVFASANMAHPQALVAAGRASAVTAFAGNALCALAAPGFALRGRTLVQRLLDDEVRVGISTPLADPAGDYAFALFERIESRGAAGAGAAAALKAKALQLTGGPQSPAPPAGRNVYAELVATGQADVFITYCTNATVARHERSELQVLALPAAVNVAAQYGLVVLEPVSADARAWARFVSGPAGQAILAAHGFIAP